MLHLIYGEVGSGKTVLLDKKIAEAVKAKRRSYLIVPEQSTVAAERRMAESLPPESPLVFEATNFTRLADTFFRSEGGLALRYATPTARSLAMWRALRELTPLLPEAPELGPASLDRYLSAVRELTAGRIGAAELDAAAKGIPDQRLSGRLRGLSMILSAYRGILDERFADAESVLDVLFDKMQTSGFFSGNAFFFDSFTGFTEQQYAVLSALIPEAEVTVTLPLPRDPESSICYEEPISTRLRLIAMAKRAGVGYDETQLGCNRRTESEAIRHLTSHLFSSDVEANVLDVPSDGSVRLVSADDPYDAARFVAADILKKTAEEGSLFRDFAILSGSPEIYRGILDVELSRNGIPYFFSQRTDLSVLEPLKLVTSAYRVVTGNFRRGDVISVVKCGFSGLSSREADELELYAETWSLSGEAFRDPAPWTMNPDGYSKKDQKKLYTVAWLDDVNRAKEKVLIPLRKLAAASKMQPVPDHCRAIYDYLTGLSLPDQLSERAARAAEDGDAERAELYDRFFGVALTALDTLAEMLSDVTVTAEEFSALFDLVCRTSDVGRIPSSEDEVLIGSAGLLRAGGVRHVYLFGANEGEFPGIVRGSGYFSESDRKRLAEVGVEIGGARKMRASRELFSFLRAVSAPTVSVTVVSNGLAADLVTQRTPSSAVLRIGTLLPNGVERIRVSDLPPLSLIRSRNAALAEIGRIVRDPLFAPLKNVLSRDPEGAAILQAAKIPISNFTGKLSPETAAQIFPKRMVLSQSRIETFLKCPLSYFCEKVLNLRESEPATFGQSDVGSYVHAMLEAFFRASEGKNQELQPREIAELTESFSRAYLDEVGQGMEQTPRMTYLFGKLKRSTELLIQHVQDEISDGDFTPRFFELKLKPEDTAGGIGDSPAALRVETDGGGTLYIDGTVDRVDTATIGGDLYLRVVDYKTGKKELRMSDVEKGKNLQLLLYIFALWKNRNPAFVKTLGVPEGGSVRPASLRYLHAVTEKVKLDQPCPIDDVYKKYEETITQNGFLLDDPAVIGAMDHSGEHRFVPDYNAKKKSQSFKTEEELGRLLTETEGILRRIVSDMRSGSVRATPGGDNCRFCKMAPICRKGSSRGSAEED
ncbi:MAG: PD-(D/E)XK nuclease family protein [Clostridia bacterium]|nr:PD-(D/E)XK nuclease family protein [Clostridia bacterium]